MKILVGYDGSDCSDIALRDLERAGLPANSEVRLLSVADTFMPKLETSDVSAHPLVTQHMSNAATHANAAIEKARNAAAQGRDKLAAQHPEWTITADSVADAPAWALVTASEDWGADLIVVGSHGYGMFDRFVLGSVSQKVLAEAHCSVRVVKNAAESAGATRILLGYDGSEDAQSALNSVLSREWPEGTQVHVIAAVDLRMITAISYLSVFVDEILTTTEEEDHALVRNANEQACMKLREKGLIAESVVRDGDPKKIILKYAEDWQPDMIFVGAHGTTKTEKFMIGSVSSAIAARAKCTVEVVRGQ